jgi:hypothetical protein
MSAKTQPNYIGGMNIAMKLPPHVYDQTVSFYGAVLCLAVHEEDSSGIVFEFGANRLWLDRADHLSQAEIWLEINTDDIPAATDYLSRKGTVRRDEIKALSAY